ncbi:unnamed protein product [Sympodiomycopsis kandeliae]
MSFHRNHKSTKVPNVKLKPKPRNSSSAAHLDDDLAANRNLEDQYAQRDIQADRNAKRRRLGRRGDDSDGNDEDGDDDELPLKGAFFCFTGIGDDKTPLAHAATSLGATVDGDLTETTTHLVALSCGSQKYKFALQLGLYILRPSFLYTLHEEWQQANPIDLQSLLEHHTLPPLQGLHVGISGITDSTLKNSIKTQLKEMGAHLEFPMTFDSGVTHLICGTNDRKKSSTLDTVYQLRKGFKGTSEERKGAINLHCIWTEWITDCQSIGGCLPEDKYEISSTGKKGPELTTRISVTSQFPKRDSKSMMIRFKEKLKENQNGYLAKLHQQQSNATHKVVPSAGHVTRTTSSSATATASAAADKCSSRSSDATAKASPGQRHPPDAADKSSSGPSHPSDRSARSDKPTSGLLGMARNVKDEQEEQQGDLKQHHSTQTTSKRDDSTATQALDARPLSGKYIYIDLSQRDEGKLQVVREACLDAGAHLIIDEAQWEHALIPDDDTCRAVILVSIICPASDRTEQLDLQSRLSTQYHITKPPLVTLPWLEQCLHWETFLNPHTLHKSKDSESYSYLPFLLSPHPSLTLPLPQSGSRIALTNYPPIDVSPHRSQLKQILTLLGFTVTDSFGKKQNTHLFSPFADQLLLVEDLQAYGLERKLSLVKEVKARDWKKEVVGVKWLSEIWSNGNVELICPEMMKEEQDVTLGEDTMDVTMGETLDVTRDETLDVARGETLAATELRTRGEDQDVTEMATRGEDQAAAEEDTQAVAIGGKDTSDKSLAVAEEHPRPDHQIEVEVKQPPPAATTEVPPPVPRNDVGNPAPTALDRRHSIESQKPLLQSHHPATDVAPPETQTLAGQSMWATRMQGEVEALFRDRDQNATSPPSASKNAPTPSISTRPKGKLPPKSRRSAAGPDPTRTRTESPVPHTARNTLGSRSNSISPFKSTDGADQGNIDAAKVLAEHRLQQQQYDTSNNSSRTNSTNRSHGGYRDEDENEVEESIRVTYRDPAAEKERKKLQDLVERGERERERAAREDGENHLPDKTSTTSNKNTASPTSTFGTGRSRPPAPASDTSPKKKVVARKQPGSRQ